MTERFGRELRFAAERVAAELDDGGIRELAVATLADAALFRPVVGRVQRAVDRRFYRAHYDAATTIEAFASGLREDIDIDSLVG